jgi:hypothetical protein
VRRLLVSRATQRHDHSHFWLFFKINAPAVIISTIAIITARNEVREISRQLLRDLDLAAHRTEISEMQLLQYSAWILSWIAFSFVFGATCVAVEESVAGFTASPWRSFLNIRERLVPFLGLSLLLCVLVAMTEGASVLLATVRSGYCINGEYIQPLFLFGSFTMDLPG